MPQGEHEWSTAAAKDPLRQITQHGLRTTDHDRAAVYPVAGAMQMTGWLLERPVDLAPAVDVVDALRGVHATCRIRGRGADRLGLGSRQLERAGRVSGAQAWHRLGVRGVW